MCFYYYSMIKALQLLPWECPHNYPPVRISPKVHLMAWYTSGFE